MTNVPFEEPDKTVILALEACFYVTPDDPFLIHDELYEICRIAGFKEGQVGDALSRQQQLVQRYFGFDKIELSDEFLYFSMPYMRFKSQHLCNVKLMDTILNYVFDEVDRVGINHVKLSMDSLIENTKAKLAISELEIRTALALMQKYKYFKIEKGTLTLAGSRAKRDSAITIAKSNMFRDKDEARMLEVLPIVKNVVSRRSAGKSASIDPIKAVEVVIQKISSENFRAWWRLTANELAVLDTQKTPTASLTASCALCEAALSIFANQIRKLGIFPNALKTLPSQPKEWKLTKLANFFAHPEVKILDDKIRGAVITMSEQRWRVHVGRYIAADSSTLPIPDLNPEQADYSIQVMKMVLRSLLDWHEMRSLDN